MAQADGSVFVEMVFGMKTFANMTKMAARCGVSSLKRIHESHHHLGGSSQAVGGRVGGKDKL